MTYISPLFIHLFLAILCAGYISLGLFPSPQADPPCVPTPTVLSVTNSQEQITTLTVDRLIEFGSISIDNPYILEWDQSSGVIAVQTQSDDFRKRVLLIDPSSVNITGVFTIPEDWTLLDVQPQNSWFALTTARDEITIRNIKNVDVHTIRIPGGFISATFDPDGTSIWVTSDEEIKFIKFDISSGKKIEECARFSTAAPVYNARPSPGNRWIIWSSRATIQLNNKVECLSGIRFDHEDFVTAYALDHSEDVLATSAGGSIGEEFMPLINLWDANTGIKHSALPLTDSPAMGLSFSIDDTLLAHAGSGLSVWNIKNGNEVKKIAGPDERFSSVMFSPDGVYLAATVEDELKLYAIARETD